MQPDAPAFPHTWTQWIYTILAGFVLYGGGLITAWVKRKHGPAEVAKLHAEARQISVSTDISLIEAATNAIAGAQRLRDERDHWERKAEALQRKIDLLNIEVASTDQQMRRLHGFIQSKGWSYSEYDTPKRLD